MVAVSRSKIQFLMAGVHHQHALVMDTFHMLTAMQWAYPSCLTASLFSMAVVSKITASTCARAELALFMLTACQEMRHFAQKLQSGASMKGECWS